MAQREGAWAAATRASTASSAFRGVSPGAAAMDASAATQVNKLQVDLRDLQAKYEAQSALLAETEADLREARLAGVAAANAGRAGVGFAGEEAASDQLADLKHSLIKMEQERNQLRMQRADLEHKLADAEARVGEGQRQISDHESEIHAFTLQVAQLQSNLAATAAAAAKFERDAKAAQSRVTELEDDNDRFRAQLAEREELLEGVREQTENMVSYKKEMADARRTIDAQRRQLVAVAEDSNRQLNELQNLLQSHNHMLEELKLEYESFQDMARIEHEQELKEAAARYSDLQARFDKFRLLQFEDRQQIMRENREVVKALQTHFEVYRSTAEALFATEAAKLEEKLAAQSRKYEAEIRLLLRAKDLHFDTMMRAKDAKIMSLIEGTDFQAILLKHEMELAQMREQQEAAVQAALGEAWTENERYNDQLRKRIVSMGVQLDSLKQKTKAQAGVVSRLHKTLASATEAEKKRGIEHHEQLQEVLRKLDEEVQRSEALSRERYVLRVKLARAQSGQGTAAASSAGAATLLSGAAEETSGLERKVEEAERRARLAEAELSHLREAHRRTVERRSQLQQKLLSQEEECSRITDTFQRYLSGRVGERASSLSRMSTSTLDKVAGGGTVHRSRSSPIPDVTAGLSRKRRARGARGIPAPGVGPPRSPAVPGCAAGSRQHIAGSASIASGTASSARTGGTPAGEEPTGRTGKAGTGRAGSAQQHAGVAESPATGEMGRDSQEVDLAAGKQALRDFNQASLHHKLLSHGRRPIPR